ncbi:MAG: hypothetical protein WD048_06880 [Chitinophagales bacterium]
MKGSIIIGAVVGALIGFFVGYFLFAEDLSISQVIFGADTGVELFDNIGDNILENDRLKVLVTTLVGLAIGALVPGFLKK